MCSLLCAPRFLDSQERGAIALGEAVLGLGVNTRVLMIGAHPDDEDTFLITWLSRGRHVKTAYLSLTRGDGGQNLIGNELGEALGVIRTEELLAARRIDGAEQYFTRAYDFGFSKDTVDAYAHWDKETILGDVVRVVRDFRPHVIVAVFSGTARDGHGQHQVSGLLARSAYDVSGDTLRFPVASHGAPWTVAKFYRDARLNRQNGTLGMDVGEYSPVTGRFLGEIAGESRSQHRSQGFGALQRRGRILAYVRREASRVNEATPPDQERTFFDGIDTSWARFRPLMRDDRQRRALDSIPIALTAVRAVFDPYQPTKLLPSLQRAGLYLTRVCGEMHGRCNAGLPENTDLHRDLYQSATIAKLRVNALRALASSVTIDATARRELIAAGAVVPVDVTIYNSSSDTVHIIHASATGWRAPRSDRRSIAPGGVLHDTIAFSPHPQVTEPHWLAATPAGRRTGGMFPGHMGVAENRLNEHYVQYGAVGSDGAMFALIAPVTYRIVDDVRGEVRRQVARVPAISVTLDHDFQYASANADIDRAMAIHLRSADERERDARVSPVLPPGLSTDTAARVVRLEGYDAKVSTVFRIQGRLQAGEHRIGAIVESNGQRFLSGYELIDYDHIRPQRIYHRAEIRVSAVDVRVPPTLNVGYIAGVSDNVAPALMQLGIPVTVVPAADIARAPLSSYTTIVIGPRAYEANPELVAANARLIDFARQGGTVVAQYGQYEMTQPGIMPYPITINRPHDRVTHEDAPVTILDPSARELTWPNRITDADFAGWVQERSLYMPRTFDGRYRPLLAMSDPGESPNRGAILVAPVGEGQYVYTTLAFFRQLPAGIPGAARLFVNLLSAGIPVPRTNP